jgi:integrase
MPLELRWKLSGPLRPFWYGRYEVNGKRYCPNLGVKIAGTPPASMSLMDEGDAAFERSRAAAQAKLDSIVEEARSKRNAAGLVEKLYEIKTGEAIKSVKLAELADEWAKIERKREPNERYASQCQSTLRRFVEFVRQENPKADEIAHVTRTLSRAFLDAEMKRGVTAKTWNDTLKLLRATFRYLLPAGAINPFADTPTKETETVFRKPFTPEELKVILDTAHNDDFIRPLIVTGICTAMRRGDCCLLKWKDVDLARRFITVKTAKTGVTVSIPIFPMLREELAARSSARSQRGEGYVFPEQARMYLENPDGITWRVKKILAVALGEPLEEGGDKNALPEVSNDEARKRGLDFIAKMPDGAKKERMTTVFDLYMDGKKTCEVVAAAGVSKGTVSGHLNEIETAVGCRIVRGRAEGGSMAALLKTDSDLLRTEREGGTRRASVRDFHSFRVTWVTLALTAGIPLELVQKVTGHKTTDIVLKHYFQPGREEFRQALNAAMPKLLTNGNHPAEGAAKTKPPQEQIRDIAETATAKTWKRDMARILQVLDRL